MDAKCVRVLRPYKENKSMELLIDEEARATLMCNWGDTITAKGKRDVKVIVKPLNDIDQDGFICRAGSALIDALFVEYGEEILLT